MYDARANSGIDRMKIIDAVAKSVPGPHKVDLKNPQKTIVVEIVKVRSSLLRFANVIFELITAKIVSTQSHATIYFKCASFGLVP